MEQQKFTILIPTRERADTLFHALRTCTSQKYDNLTILVSDNYSQDNTEQVVRSFGDPRVQYVNTGERLSMSHNWEFALSQVKDGFVTILGDDDGFLPNAVSYANNLLSETKLLAINMSPRADFYLWPSYFKKEQASMMKVSFGNSYEVKSGKQELFKVLKCQQGHYPLIGLYSSFVHMSVIDRVKQVSGTMFRAQAPDLYSSVALANMVGDYVLSKRTMRLSGQSSHSTGASLGSYGTNKQAANLFTNESNIPIHPKMMLSQSYSYILAENFLQSFDAGLNQEEQKDFDFMPFIITALKEANTGFKGQYDSIIEATRYIAEHNNLDRVAIEKLIATIHNRRFNIIWYDIERHLYPFLFFDASKYGTMDIFGACGLYADIRKNPGKYLSKLSTWKYMFDSTLGAFGRQYSRTD